MIFRRNDEWVSIRGAGPSFAPIYPVDHEIVAQLSIARYLALGNEMNDELPIRTYA